MPAPIAAPMRKWIFALGMLSHRAFAFLIGVHHARSALVWILCRGRIGLLIIKRLNSQEGIIYCFPSVISKRLIPHFPICIPITQYAADTITLFLKAILDEKCVCPELHFCPRPRERFWFVINNIECCRINP